MKYCTTCFLLILFIQIFCVISPLESGVYSSLTDEQKKLIMNSSTRAIFSLSGEWEYSFDGNEWNAKILPDIFYNTSKVIFRKIVRVDSKLMGNYVWHLYFLGVSEEVEIFWNDQFLGKYVSEGSPLWITIPRRMVVSERNELRLVVNSSESLARLVKRQYQYYRKIVTGIHWDFFLVRSPQIWINYFTYSLKFDGPNRVNIFTRLNINSFEIENILSRGNPNATASKGSFNCEASIRMKETNQIVATSGKQNFEISSFRNINQELSLGVLNPIFWDVDNPKLYELVLRIEHNGEIIDEIVSDVGFSRWDMVKVKGGYGWLLNGKPFVVKGVDFVDDYDYYNFGNTFKKFQQDLALIKSLGANAIRFKYAPPNPIVVKLCNVYGIFVLIDLPVYNIPGGLVKRYDLFVRFQTIATNIARHFNPNPSFLGVGLGEGLLEQSSNIQDYFDGLAKKLRHFDRLFIYKTVILDDHNYSVSNFDFIILKDNLRFQSLDKISSELVFHTSYSLKPLVYNFGTVINPDNRNGYNDKLSLEYQAYSFLQRYYLSVNAGLWGTICWSFADYFTENPLSKTGQINPFVCYSGIVDVRRQPRLAYNTIKALFNNEEPPVINPGTVENVFPVAYIAIGLVSAIILGFLLYRSRRFREYFMRSAFRSYNFFADLRDRRIISGVQTSFLGIVFALIVGIYISTILNYYKMDDSFQLILSIIFPYIFVREWLYRISWFPEASIFVFSAIFYVKMLLLALLLRILSVFVRNKIAFSDTFKMVIWGCLPLILFLPVSIFINRVFSISVLLTYFFNLFFIVLILWCLLRIVKATWIVFDVSSTKVLLWAAVIIAIVIFSIFTYYQYTYNIIDYVGYYLERY